MHHGDVSPDIAAGLLALRKHIAVAKIPSSQLDESINAGYSRQEFSYQLSDHFPIWVQIDTDIDGQRLTQIVQNAKK